MTILSVVTPRSLALAAALVLAGALLAEPVPAEKAEAWGLIWKCVPDGELIEEAGRICTLFASGPTYGSRRPMVIRPPRRHGCWSCWPASAPTACT